MSHKIIRSKIIEESKLETNNSHGQLILDPSFEIPEKEKWLFKNTEALEKVLRGLKDAAAGRYKHVKL